MIKRKIVIMAFLTFCLTATLFMGVTSSGTQIDEDITQFPWTKTIEYTNPSTASILPYDPWMDINDDGIIDIEDLTQVSLRLWEQGTPINKTALLLGLQSMVDYLNEALETRVPKSGYISVSAAAFEVQHSTYDFSVEHVLRHSENFTVYFYGSVQLPNGANVTNVTFYWWDQGDENMVCRLWRYNQTHNQEMIEMWSSGNTGHGSSSSDAVAFATVDNSQYAYYLEVGIPGESNGHGAYHFQYAVIEYEYPI